MSGEWSTSQGSTRPWRQGMPTALVLCIAFVALQWVGCSVEKNYELLNKFFDGVPDPNATGPRDQLAISKSPTFSEHRPFTDDACSECHDDPSATMLTKDDSSVCMRCHTQIKDQYPMMHGAVTGNACLMCHNPHLSPLAHLLREKAPGLCLQCHEMETQIPTPSHEDLGQDCLSCHRGHGGDAPFFLLDQAFTDPQLAPNPAPASDPAPADGQSQQQE